MNPINSFLFRAFIYRRRSVYATPSPSYCPHPPHIHTYVLLSVAQSFQLQNKSTKRRKTHTHTHTLEADIWVRFVERGAFIFGRSVLCRTIEICHGAGFNCAAHNTRELSCKTSKPWNPDRLSVGTLARRFFLRFEKGREAAAKQCERARPLGRTQARDWIKEY